MKKHRKKVIAIFAACMFAMMMMLNVNTTINGTNFSVEGYTALVSGSTVGDWVSCRYYTGFGQYYGTSCWSCTVVSNVGYGQVGLCKK